MIILMLQLVLIKILMPRLFIRLYQNVTKPDIESNVSDMKNLM